MVSDKGEHSLGLADTETKKKSGWTNKWKQERKNERNQRLNEIKKKSDKRKIQTNKS